MNKIRTYIENLLEEIPETKKVRELKEELIADLTEKYEDLLKAGKNEKEAYGEVIAGIGDIEELMESMKEDVQERNLIEREIIRKQKTKALVVSVSVGLYILSLILIAISEELGLPEFVSITSFFSIAGLATCILIYYFVSIPKELSGKTGVQVQEKVETNDIRNAIHSILWLTITAIYFLISFLFTAWAISWIIFIIGVIIQNIIDLLLGMKGK